MSPDIVWEGFCHDQLRGHGAQGRNALKRVLLKGGVLSVVFPAASRTQCKAWHTFIFSAGLMNV